MSIEPSQKNHFPAGFTIKQNIYGVPLSEEQVNGWDVDRTRLSLEKEYTLLDVFHTPNMQVSYVRRSFAVHIWGRMPKDSIIFGCFAHEGIVTSRYHLMYSNHLFAMDDHQPIDIISQGPSELFGITINKSLFLERYKARFCKEYVAPIHANLFICDAEVMLKVRRQLHACFKAFTFYQHPNERLLSSYEACLFDMLFSMLETKQEIFPAVQSHVDAYAALRYIHENFTTDMTIGTMCKDLQISERTMYSAFKKLYGITPKTFLLYLRLGQVHETLMQEEAYALSIQEIAYRFAFTHMGHFSKNYKNFYGESPSQTRIKSQQRYLFDAL